MGLERAHAEFLGQGEGLLIVGLGLLDIRRLAPRCSVAEEAQGIRLVATFLVRTGMRQCMLGKGVRIPPSGQSVAVPHSGGDNTAPDTILLP